MYKIKELNWKESYEKNVEIVFYVLDTSIGYYAVNKFLAVGRNKEWFTYRLPFPFDFDSKSCGSVEEGKALCEEHYKSIILNCLEEVKS